MRSFDHKFTHLPPGQPCSIYYNRNKMQTTYSNAFLCKKSFVFSLRCQWNLFPVVRSTIRHHWLIYWLAVCLAASHYLNQWLTRILTKTKTCLPRGKLWSMRTNLKHYNDVIMNTMASRITSLTTVYSTVYSRCRSKKASKLRATGLLGEFTGHRWIPHTKGQ